MKILFYSDTAYADCDFPLIRAFQEKGYDITYLINLHPRNLRKTLFNIKTQLQRNDIIPISEYQEFEIYGKYMDLSKVYVINCISNKGLSFASFHMTQKVIKFIKEGNFDIIHTDCMFDLWNMLLYLPFRNKLILTVHDPFPHTGEGSIRRSLRYRIAFANIKYYVLLNSKQKETFCSKYSINSHNVLINKLGIYDSIRAFASSQVQVSKHNVLFFGRISPYKGIEYLCRAMVKVRKEIPDATLTIAGNGNLYFDFSEYQNYKWINLRQHYVDMKELATLLQRSDIVVCPYTDATQSGVIMTCFALTKPVIVTDVGGLSEMVESGKTGIVVPPRNSEVLANAIISVLKNDHIKELMCQNINDKYFHGEESWNSIVDKYIEFYNKKIQ